MFNLFNTSVNLSLSSTLSMLSYGVPKILTPAFARGTDRLMEV